ncbi:hypothetical protein KKC60_03180, partial [Patescibacteria group bacterium]|nr:hypothetical protein [Patescibacteria group bacterium]
MKRKQVAIIISVIAFVLVLVGVVGFVFYTVSDKGRNSAPLPSFVTEEKWWVVLAAEIARDSEKPSKKEPADKMGPYEKIEYGMGIDKENFWYQPSSFGEEFLNVNGNEYETGTHLRLVDRDIAVEGDNVVFSYYTDSGNYYINLNGKKIGPFDSEHALSKEIVDASEQHVGFSFIHKDRVGFVVDEKLYGPFHGVCINTTSSTEIKPEYNCTGMDYYTTAFQIEGNNWGFYYPENAEEFNRRVREEKLDTPSTSIQDWYVVLNGEKYGPFASRPELFVTEEKTAFVGDGSLWVDGEKKSDFGSSYDLGLVKDGLVTSIYEDSETNKKKYVRINDKSYGPFDAVESLSFTIKDGKWGFSFL